MKNAYRDQIQEIWKASNNDIEYFLEVLAEILEIEDHANERTINRLTLEVAQLKDTIVKDEIHRRRILEELEIARQNSFF